MAWEWNLQPVRLSFTIFKKNVGVPRQSSTFVSVKAVNVNPSVLFTSKTNIFGVENIGSGNYSLTLTGIYCAIKRVSIAPVKLVDSFLCSATARLHFDCQHFHPPTPPPPFLLFLASLAHVSLAVKSARACDMCIAEQTFRPVVALHCCILPVAAAEHPPLLRRSRFDLIICVVIVDIRSCALRRRRRHR